MKTLRVSDVVHNKLTRLLGERMAMTGKTQTYDNIMEALISQSIFLPTELLKNIDEALSANKTEGITTREEFIKDAVTTLLKNLSNKSGQKQLK